MTEGSTPIKAIKEFIRIPRITQHNQFIKDEIAKRTEEILALEDKTLSEVVDFSGVMAQKFDSVSVEGANLILLKGDEKIRCKVTTDTKLVAKIVKKKYQKEELTLEKMIIGLPELKSLPVIDTEKQKALKDYIDDLVFALYFNVELKNIGLEKAHLVRTSCSSNKYYETIRRHVTTD